MTLAAPGTRRIYSNAGFDALGAPSSRRVPASRSRRSCGVRPRAARHDGDVAARTAVAGPARPVRATRARSPRNCCARRWSRRRRSPPRRRVAFPGLVGLLPGVGRFDPLDWGLGFELHDGKSPHWMADANSPATFGHFGGSGTFLWVDPDADVALVVLTDREYGPWALEAWPRFGDRHPRAGGRGSGLDAATIRPWTTACASRTSRPAPRPRASKPRPRSPSDSAGRPSGRPTTSSCPTTRQPDYGRIYEAILTLAWVGARHPRVRLGDERDRRPAAERGPAREGARHARFAERRPGDRRASASAGTQAEFANLGMADRFHVRGAYLDETIRLWRHLWSRLDASRSTGASTRSTTSRSGRCPVQAAAADRRRRPRGARPCAGPGRSPTAITRARRQPGDLRGRASRSSRRRPRRPAARRRRCRHGSASSSAQATGTRLRDARRPGGHRRRGPGVGRASASTHLALYFDDDRSSSARRAFVARCAARLSALGYVATMPKAPRRHEEMVMGDKTPKRPPKPKKPKAPTT